MEWRIARRWRCTGWDSALVALLITLTSIGLGLKAAGQPTLRASYEAFCTWDCAWYGHIVEKGYRSAIPPERQNADRSNVAFFPGFPMAAGALRAVTRLPTRAALPLTAQLFCWGFWFYFLIFLRRVKASRFRMALSVGAVLAHPASFFLVFGYSESLFLASMTGFVLLWLTRGQRSWLEAGAHGFVMSATRLTGIPLAAVPVLQAFLRRGFKAPSRRAWGAALLAGGGAAAFFAWCQLRFGHWDLYMQTQRIGWDIVPDYGAFFRRGTFRWDAHEDQWAPLAVLGAMLVLGGAEASLEGGACRRRKRVALYVGAWLMLYVVVSGLASRGLVSVGRYTLPVWVLLVLGANHLAQRAKPEAPWARYAVWATGALMALGLGWVFRAYSLPTAVKFLHGQWAG